MNTTLPLGAIGAILLATPAGAHNHITVDTESGRTGDQIIIVVGYLPAESNITLGKDGHLLIDGEIAVYAHDVVIEQEGPLHEWMAADELVLTSDFFFGGGHLNGGNFLYEIADVHAVKAAAGESEFAWGVSEAGELTVEAISSGLTRLERSFDTGIGGHQHGQFAAVSQGGIYDVTLVAWDSNGVYADSDPIIVRIDAGGACPGDTDHSGAVDVTDLVTVILLWGTADHDADVNHDGIVDVLDLVEVVLNWGACS